MLVFGDDAVDRGLLRAEQAKREAILGRGDQALELANEASTLLGDDARHASRGWHALAAAHVVLGDMDAADAEYRRAVDALAERGQWREAVRISQDWATDLRAAGREADAYGVLERATSFGQSVSGAVS